MQLSEKILALRKSRGMSQEDLAAALGVTRQTVSRWEVGSALPDAENLLQLSLLFRVSADYLLGDDNPTHGQMEPSSDVEPAGREVSDAEDAEEDAGTHWVRISEFRKPGFALRLCCLPLLLGAIVLLVLGLTNREIGNVLAALGLAAISVALLVFAEKRDYAAGITAHWMFSEQLVDKDGQPVRRK